VAALQSLGESLSHALRSSTEVPSLDQGVNFAAYAAAQRSGGFSSANSDAAARESPLVDALKQHSSVVEHVSAAANPAPRGLRSFGIATLLVDVDLYGTTAKNLFGVALITGDLDQFIAGMWCFRYDNLFCATAFSIYSVFWGARSIQLLVELLNPSRSPATDRAGTFIYCVIYCVVSQCSVPRH